MSRFKDAYIAELEAEMAKLEEEGVPSDKAYELAGQRAYDAMREKLAEQGDMLRQKLKEWQQ